METIGTIASIIILISFLFTNIKTIRKINVIGCVLFIIYGIKINTFSIWFLNGGLLLIHIYYLIKEEIK